MSDYIYTGDYEDRSETSGGPHELLEPGDYEFEVVNFTEPYQKPDGKWVLKLTLGILPGHEWVWANPWRGTDRNGKKHNKIDEFLACVNRAPKKGESPDWDSIIGAKGKCRIKHEPDFTDPEKMREAVDFFFAPKAIGPGAGETKFSQQEYAEKMTAAQKPANREYIKMMSQPKPADDEEPDEIPFLTTIYKDVRNSRLNRRVM
jgi:hypothetical protein